MQPITVRQATLEDLPIVAAILEEAASWLEQRNMALWGDDEISLQVLRPDVQSGLFHLAICGSSVVGVVKFQTEDLLFWPDIPHQDSAFIHRLAVRRSFSGGSVSVALMQWAVDHSRKLGKRYLRLDCEADRQPLRLVYERFGFWHHSDKQVGPYFVARYEREV
ncbi:MAG: GNAT family N-acetyltransferase [Cyanobacteria bacterium P01_A01_bin.17]